MSAVQITYVANASTGVANVTSAGLSGVTGIASYLAYYDNNAYSAGHAANLGWSSVGGLGGTVQIGDDTFGVTAISTGQLYSDTAISTTLSGLDWIVSAGGSVDVSNTDGTVTGELSSLVYSLFDGSSTAPRTNHTVFGEVGLVEFGSGITTNLDGTVSVSTGYFEIEGLSQYWGNGLGDTNSDGVYDYVQSRDGTDNLVQEAALGLMGGYSGTEGTHTGAITDAFDALGTVVYGTTGGETFTGYASVDTFFLGGGVDKVENFTVGAGGDVIVIDSTLYASAAAAAAAVDYTGVNAVLSYGNASGSTDSIEFTGITGGLTADNFILV